MEIILTSEDIRTMVSDYYAGVEEVKFIGEKEVEIRVKINPEKFFKKTKLQTSAVAQPTLPSPPVTPKTLEEQNVERAKKGAMATGGSARSMMRF